MKIGKLLAEDLEAGALRLKLEKALRGFGEEKGDRKRELHVSDFTPRDGLWCARRLVARFFLGETRERRLTWVHYDGKEREAKWLKLFQKAGILREYQPEVKVGVLVGHPDFDVDFGFGPRILELTGYDGKTPPTLHYERMAQKRRQCLAYVVMRGYAKGFVLAEDKGANTFKIEVVENDPDKANALVERVSLVTKATDAFDQAKTRQERMKVLRALPRCQKKRCNTCDAVELAKGV